MKYVYPAILTPEDGAYNVDFPDLPGCYTCGDDLADALHMANDALSLWLCRSEEKNSPIPAASRTVEAPEGSTVSLILADTDQYRRRMYPERSVRKTLTIPAWLNEAAEARSVNFSQVLQEALRERLSL